MPAKVRRQTFLDGLGRQWDVSIVPSAEADVEDARFWYEELTPEQRVEAVGECIVSSLKAQGRSVPRFRRVARRVERSAR